MDANILQALQAKFGTSDFSRFQVIRSPWYDTVRLAPAGTSQLQFFTVPQGGTDPVSGLAKTSEDTNVVQQGTFGQTYFLLTQVSTYVFLVAKNRQANAAVSGDANAVTHGLSHQATSYFGQLQNLFTRGWLEVAFGQKNYIQVNQPFLNMPPGFGVDIGVLPQASLAADAIRSGPWIAQDNQMQNRYQLSPLQLIEPQVQIAAAIMFAPNNSPAFTNTFLTTAGAQSTPSVNVMLIFDGYQIRPNQ